MALISKPVVRVLVASVGLGACVVSPVFARMHRARPHLARHRLVPVAAIRAPQPPAPVVIPPAPTPGYATTRGFYGQLGYGFPFFRPNGGLGLLGVLHGGGLSGYVECSYGYSRYPGACGY